MLTAVQRAEILALTADSGLDSSTATDENIWYDFLSSLFGAGKTLKDLKLSKSQQPEIMACLRRAASVRAAHVRRPQRGPHLVSLGAVEHPDWRIGTAITAEFSI